MSKAYARLISDERGTWYKGRATDGNVCEGEDALIYEPEYLTGDALVEWRSQMHQLVIDGHAEYV